MPERKRQLTPDVVLNQYPFVVPLKANGTVHLNPVVYDDFKLTTTTPKEHVTFYFMDDAETELGMFWSDKVYGAVKVNESKSEGTANFRVGLLLKKYPALKVERGRERPFPAQIVTCDDGVKGLVIKVTNIDPVPARTNSSKGGSKSGGDQSKS